MLRRIEIFHLEQVENLPYYLILLNLLNKFKVERAELSATFSFHLKRPVSYFSKGYVSRDFRRRSVLCQPILHGYFGQCSTDMLLFRFKTLINRSFWQLPKQSHLIPDYPGSAI